MKKHLLEIGGLVLLVIVILVVLWLTKAKPTAQSTPPPAETTTEDVMNKNTIGIKDFKYNPQSLKVKSGEKITVVNKDLPGHSVTSDDGTSFDSGVIGQDQDGTITAPQTPGSYPFHCIPHPSIKGELIVE